MHTIRSFAANNPILFVLIVAVAWFILLMLVMGILCSVMRKPYGDPAASTAARILVTGGVIILLWQLGWLEGSGVTRAGNWQAWLLALVGLIYLTAASLYAFFGKIAFDFTQVVRLPQTPGILSTTLFVGLSEEIMFRGLVLYALARAWGNTSQGLIGSVLVTALLFAALHISQVLTHKITMTSALLLALQTTLLSIWWGALVVVGGSIWPVVVLHILSNTIVPLQGLVAPMLEPAELVYQRLMWLSIPLGALGLGLLGLNLPHVRPLEHG